MEEKDEVEPEYLRGFNDGYLISKDNPALAEKLANIDSDFIRLVGFKDGRKQYQMEQTKDRLPGWLKGDRLADSRNSPDKTKGLDREPDDDR